MFGEGNRLYPDVSAGQEALIVALLPFVASDPPGALADTADTADTEAAWLGSPAGAAQVAADLAEASSRRLWEPWLALGTVAAVAFLFLFAYHRQKSQPIAAEGR